MANAFIGVVLGWLIGACCRWFDVPLPAPPKLVGALLVVAMTLGYLGTGLAL
jgi:XapX domain-containing protein